MTTRPPGAENRLLLPRWRTLSRSLHDLRSASQLSPHRHEFASLDEAVESFRAHPGPFTAGDLLAQARVSGQQHEILSAAEELLDGAVSAVQAGNPLPVVCPAVAEDDDSVSGWRNRVRLDRMILKNEPRNALRWTDLALSHVTLGNLASAARAMSVAHALAPDNRHVLRSMARLSTITGEERQARRSILASNATRDPWVVAAEVGLSLSLGAGSRLARPGRDLVQGGLIDPRHISELASALGTQELMAGSTRRAAMLLRSSLVDPTENALAQAVWSRQQGSGIREAEVSFHLERGFEAESLRLVGEGRIHDALRPAECWLEDQPFAPEPAIFLSWLAVMAAGRPDVAIKAARRGIVANPHSWVLHNNLAVGLALMGQVAPAQLQLRNVQRADVPQEHLGTLIATEGLVLFRSGAHEQGRLKYEEAARRYLRRGDRERTAIALLSHAREEFVSGTGFGHTVLAVALEQARRVDDPLVLKMLEEVAAMAGGDAPPG